jgi:protein-S-isoprenylcysteine O-methyltransferase Ste14
VRTTWFLPGLIVSVVGEILQIWCFSTIKTKKRLTVTGPYMFVRNPMYISRFFQLFGIIMMSGNPWLMLAFAGIYYFYMVNRVRREEAVLTDLFGKDYEAYCRDVNRYIPGLKRFDAKQLWSFDKESFRQNHAFINLAATTICYMVLYTVTFHG